MLIPNLRVKVLLDVTTVYTTLMTGFYVRVKKKNTCNWLLWELVGGGGGGGGAGGGAVGGGGSGGCGGAVVGVVVVVSWEMEMGCINE